jgi:hypothetical protein
LQLITIAITGAVLGAALGFTQWLALRRHLSAAGYWIPATSLAGAVVAFVSPTTSLDSSFGLAPVVAAQLITGVIVGSIMGTTLVWLLRKHHEVEFDASAADQ